MILDRRSLLQVGIAVPIALVAGAFQAVSAADHPVDREEWMDEVFRQQNARGDVSGALQLGRFQDPIYFLLSPIRWLPSAGEAQRLPGFSVPAGFVTDLASIPRIFWTLLRPDGDYTYAAILHDFLYWTQSSSRDVADNTLRTCMAEFGVPKASIDAIYGAVRVGGQLAWDNNNKLKSKGEKRILRTWPNDPHITWEQWKRQPGVFA